ncbi:MAG TPA: CDP-alcohol phosphatidyltransferase family protein [Solirubrobacteraceae bacterium]|nr:CDP-alcohol phosphatidyltransferase family protein [Solirubrobacteraceae bacterium]
MKVAPRALRRHGPNAATGLTLLLGLGAIEAARLGNPDLALALVLVAIVTDGIDGSLARRWGTTSSMGRHLDALADLVAFGVAPGVVFAARHPAAPPPALFLALALVAGAGAWRLARFQAEPAGPGDEAFAGLPITAAGPLFAVATSGAHPAAWTDGVVWAAGVAVLMVSRVPYGRATAGVSGLVAPVGALVFGVLLLVEARAAFLMAQALLMVYAGFGLARAVGHLAQAAAMATSDLPVGGGRRRAG